MLSVVGCDVCIAVVAAVAGAAVVAGVVDAMGFACATIAARCVSSLLVLVELRLLLRVV